MVERQSMPTGDVARLGWRDFLSRWNDQALAIVREHGLEIDRPMARFARTGSLWASPADEAEIKRREGELGLAFPESLRFLLVSNGWRSPGGHEYTIHPLARFAWLSESDPDLICAWQEPFQGVPETGPQYDVYGPEQEPVYFRSRELSSCLTLSSTTAEDGPVYLLNSARAGHDGELEAWDLDYRLAGANRHRSFADLMEVLYQEEIHELRYFAEPPRPY